MIRREDLDEVEERRLASVTLLLSIFPRESIDEDGLVLQGYLHALRKCAPWAVEKAVSWYLDHWEEPYPPRPAQFRRRSLEYVNESRHLEMTAREAKDPLMTREEAEAILDVLNDPEYQPPTEFHRAADTMMRLGAQRRLRVLDGGLPQAAALPEGGESDVDS